jgi:flagellin
VTNENLMASESDIKNIEMAEDLLKRTKNDILERSAMALLSQANKNSSDVITLLQ